MDDSQSNDKGLGCILLIIIIDIVKFAYCYLTGKPINESIEYIWKIFLWAGGIILAIVALIYIWSYLEKSFDRKQNDKKEDTITNNEEKHI